MNHCCAGDMPLCYYGPGDCMDRSLDATLDCLVTSVVGIWDAFLCGVGCVGGILCICCRDPSGGRLTGPTAPTPRAYTYITYDPYQSRHTTYRY